MWILNSIMNFRVTQLELPSAISLFCMCLWEQTCLAHPSRTCALAKQQRPKVLAA